MYLTNYWFRSVKVIKCTSVLFCLFFTDNLNFATVMWCLHRTENSVSLQSLGSVQHTYNKLLTCLIWALLTGSRVHGIFLSRLCVCVNLHKNNLKKKQSLLVSHMTCFPQALHFDNGIAKHYVVISKDCCIVWIVYYIK